MAHGMAMILFWLAYSFVWIAGIGCGIDKLRHPERYRRIKDDFVWGGVYERRDPSDRL